MVLNHEGDTGLGTARLCGVFVVVFARGVVAEVSAELWHDIMFLLGMISDVSFGVSGDSGAVILDSGMNSFFRRKFHVTVRRMRGIPPHMAFILLFPFLIFMIAEWEFLLRSSILIYILAGISVLIISILFLPLSLRIHRRKSVTALLSDHSCPHCGYSLRNLPCSDDGFTLCPECGVIWKLPELVAKSPIKWYRLMVAFMTFTILLFIFIIALSIAHGKPIISSQNITGTLLAIFYLFMMYHVLIKNKKGKPNLVMGKYHELQRENCPACHVVVDGVPMDWDGITTCAECGAVWKVSDHELECAFSEPSKFGRKYLVPTRVVDREGKQALRLMPKNQWADFIITSLMKKRCPSCVSSLSGLGSDDEGLTQCPKCGELWVLPSVADVCTYGIAGVNRQGVCVSRAEGGEN